VKYNLQTESLTVTILFDDKKTSIDTILKRLSKGGYPVSGDAQWEK